MSFDAIDYLELGLTPCDEECAQVGDINYKSLAHEQAKRYIDMLQTIFPNAPQKSTFGVKWFSHDFGSYAEVVIYYDDNNIASKAYAYFVERQLPIHWDDDRCITFDSEKELSENT